MEERRSSPHGRRISDQPSLSRTVIVLLVAILALQLLLTYIHITGTHDTEQAKQEVPATTEQQLAQPTELIVDPKAATWVEQLQKEFAEQTTQGVYVGDIQIESASSYDDVLIGARLKSTALQPIARAVCLLQLRNSAGQVIYQATGETNNNLISTAKTDVPIQFLVDNPPAFDQAKVFLEKIEFRVEGFPPDGEGK